MVVWLGHRASRMNLLARSRKHLLARSSNGSLVTTDHSATYMGANTIEFLVEANSLRASWSARAA